MGFQLQFCAMIRFLFFFLDWIGLDCDSNNMNFLLCMIFMFTIYNLQFEIIGFIFIDDICCG
ncbi:hypothetical protein BZA77DRAFT_125463 [Pyronema omphalodes]|nr:hypothetical protein BZA77DRAFT_125463 [Pyronema omphalodes]